jgi:hypothetical protein
MVRISVAWASCTEKCCTYPGWKVFFLEEELQLVAEKYGHEAAAKIAAFQSRRGGQKVYAINLPCPFLRPKRENAGVRHNSDLLLKQQLANCGGAGISARRFAHASPIEALSCAHIVLAKHSSNQLREARK